MATRQLSGKKPKNLRHTLHRLLDYMGRRDLQVSGRLEPDTPPQPELTPEQFAQLPTRVLDIHPETRATNCVGDLGGALEDMPHKCVTIGMKEILGARKLRLGVFRDWHRAVCRRAAYGEVTAAFPATLAQKHPNALLYVNSVAAGQAY